MTKECSRCHRVLKETKFNWKIKDIKRSYHCKSCSRKYLRDHYKRNILYYIKKAKKRNKKIEEECREYLVEYLRNNPCVDCGERDILVLEFDHKSKRDKFKEIANLMRWSYSLKRLIAEISKCEVRCANCHRRKTGRENGSWRLKYSIYS